LDRCDTKILDGLALERAGDLKQREDYPVVGEIDAAIRVP
jgi:hypothetical protein